MASQAAYGIITLMNRIILFIASVFILFLAEFMGIDELIIPLRQTESTPLTVTRVIDGDTIELANGERVRYIGIDTPELNSRGREEAECFAREALEKNRELVLRKEVRLEKDVSDRDRYGRLLRYVYVAGPEGKEVFVNKRLVIEGYAQAATFPPDVGFADKFLAAQQEARAKSKGLWKKCL